MFDSKSGKQQSRHFSAHVEPGICGAKFGSSEQSVCLVVLPGVVMTACRNCATADAMLDNL